MFAELSTLPGRRAGHGLGFSLQEKAGVEEAVTVVAATGPSADGPSGGGSGVGQQSEEANSSKGAQLCLAASREDLATLKELLRGGTPVDAAGKDGATPLIAAATAGRVVAVDALLAAGAAPACADKDGRTALHVAARHGHLSVVRLLLDSGAAVGQRTNSGRTALHAAAFDGREAVVEELLSAGAEVADAADGTDAPLVSAAWADEEHLGTVLALLGAGAAAGARGEEGACALHRAAWQGHCGIIQALLDAGCEVDVGDDRGCLPLHYASGSGMVDAVELLLRHGAPVDALNGGRQSPLHYASEQGWPAVVRVLLAAGAATDLKEGTEGMTPLHLAAEQGHAHVVLELLAGGTDVAARNQNGATPLHVACACGDVETASLLLAGSAPLGAADDEGVSSEFFSTPLDELLRLNCAMEFFNPDSPSCAAELVRIMAGAGCQVSQHLYCQNPNHTVLHMSTLEAWMARLAELPGAWPQQLSASALQVSRALLECAAVEDSKACPAVLPHVAATGSLELLQAVASACPQGLGGSACQHFHLLAMEDAASMFCDTMEQLAAPQGALWEEQHAGLVLHFCQLMEALVAAGCSPMRVTITDVPCPASSPSTQAPELGMRLPAWAREPLRELLPLVASGRTWAPDTRAHAAFPPGFQAAARELLLINSCCGFGLAAGQEPRLGQHAIHLPMEQLLTILQFASQPVAAWVPQLRPFV